MCVCLASSTSRFDIDIKGVEMNTFSWHLEYLTVINVFRIYFVHLFLSSIYLFHVQPFENDFLRNTMDPIQNHHSERIKCSHHIVFLLSGDSMKVGPSNVKFVLSHSWASSSFLQNLFYQLFIRRKCHVKFVKLVPTCVTNGRFLSFFSAMNVVDEDRIDCIVGRCKWVKTKTTAIIFEKIFHENFIMLCFLVQQIAVQRRKSLDYFIDCINKRNRISGWCFKYYLKCCNFFFVQTTPLSSKRG